MWVGVRGDTGEAPGSVVFCGKVGVFGKGGGVRRLGRVGTNPPARPPRGAWPRSRKHSRRWTRRQHVARVSVTGLGARGKRFESARALCVMLNPSTGSACRRVELKSPEKSMVDAMEAKNNYSHPRVAIGLAACTAVRRLAFATTDIWPCGHVESTKTGKIR